MSTEATSNAPAAAAPTQVLTFNLGSESYGIDILQVQEIRGWSPVTHIPQSPPHVLGVLNLRGSIVPIIDLRVRFGLPAEFTPLTVIIVISIHSPTGRRECGLVVDSVSDVVDLDAGMLRPAPTLNGSATTDFVRSLATLDDRMLILLDVGDLVGRDIPTAAAA
jgi:purine-binding chemotaxis protein CheW